MLATQWLVIIAAVVLGIVAVRWIQSRPPGDPALDRLLLVISPLLWFFRQFTNRRD